MPSNDRAFSEEYDTGTETTAEPHKPLLRPPDLTPEIEIETDKYVSGKPRRVVIRGKIIHD